MKTCVFCDQWGSAAFPEYREEELKQQIEQTRARLQRRFNGDTYLVYFQAYTTTFSRASNLREQFKVALAFPDVKGVVIGTRPDCISKAVLQLWRETREQGHFVGVELGVQTFSDLQLQWMQRGHSVQKSIDAIFKIKQETDVDLGIHLMFGLPGETQEQIVQTAQLINQLPIDNVKIHNLHVLRGTPLAEQFASGQFVPIERQEYLRRVVLFLEHLKPTIAVHRLVAVASRHDELVAPDWVKGKMENYQLAIDEFTKQESHQGKYFEAGGKQMLVPGPLDSSCLIPQEPILKGFLTNPPTPLPRA